MSVLWSCNNGFQEGVCESLCVGANVRSSIKLCGSGPLLLKLLFSMGAKNSYIASPGLHIVQLDPASPPVIVVGLEALEDTPQYWEALSLALLLPGTFVWCSDGRPDRDWLLRQLYHGVAIGRVTTPKDTALETDIVILARVPSTPPTLHCSTADGLSDWLFHIEPTRDPTGQADRCAEVRNEARIIVSSSCRSVSCLVVRQAEELATIAAKMAAAVSGAAPSCPPLHFASYRELLKDAASASLRVVRDCHDDFTRLEAARLEWAVNLLRRAAAGACQILLVPCRHN